MEKGTIPIEQTQQQEIRHKELERKIKEAKKDKAFLKAAKVRDKSLCLEFAENKLPKFDKVEILISRTNPNVRWVKTLDLSGFESGSVEADLAEFVEKCFGPQDVHWAIDILGSQGDQYFLYTLKRIQDDPELAEVYKVDRREDALDFLANGEFDGEKWGLRPYFNKYDTLLIDMNYSFKSYIMFLQAEVMKVSITRGVFKAEAKLADYGFKPLGMIMRRRLSKGIDFEGVKLQCKIVRKDKEWYITGELNLKMFQFGTEYIDIFIPAEDGDMVYDLPLNTKNFRINKQLQRLFKPVHYKVDKDKLFFPYTTLGSNLAFDCRKIASFDNFAFRFKERVARIIIRFFKKELEKKNIMLVYEKYCEAAQENGFFFFQYCMENDMEQYMNKEIYYVIDYKSPQYENVKKYGKKVLNYLSIKHMVYLLAAKLLVSSETKSHSYVRRCNATSIRRRLDNNLSVFLQHGVIAFKQLPFMAKNNRNSRTDLFITSSFIEKNIIVKHFEYDDNEVAVTGLARWDFLEDKSDSCREILLMPTWRRELEDVSDEEFESSPYFQHYMNLLNSEKLHAILEKNDLQLNFYIHPQLRHFIGNFSSSHPNIHLIPFGEQPLNILLMRCSMMITDYSSAIWDVYYQGKPALFYQFDINEYNLTQGSYFDMEKELFGDAAYNQEDLLFRIEEMIAKDFKEKEEYAKLRETYLPYIDHDNRKRTCEAILRAGL